MVERLLTPRMASRLAALLAEVPWTYGHLEEALAQEIPDESAALAARIIELFPEEPLDPTALVGLLRDLPKLPGSSVSMQRLLLDGPSAARSWKFGVPEYAGLDDLAGSLNLTMPELEWFTDERSWLRFKHEPLRHYRTERIPKRAGERILEIPKPRLREIQRKILRRILDKVPANDAAHGFRTGRSAHTFAALHAGADVLIGMDLSQFFTTIGKSRIFTIYTALGYPVAVARALTGLCTTVTPATALSGLPYAQASSMRFAHLPQGAPTSPALANLVAWKLDRRLSGLARSLEVQYTRYADDLAFSGGSATDVDLLLWSVRRIASDEGFSVHPSKTRVMRSHQQQHVAGLVVNDRPLVPRAEYDTLRALLHNCIRYGVGDQNRASTQDFRAHVYGRIAWVGETSDVRRQKLLAMASQVNWQTSPIG